MSLAFVLLLVALILAILAAVGVNGGRVGLFPAGFAFYLGYVILGAGLIG